MHRDAIQNALLKATLNPILKRFIRLIDRQCPEDGNLLLNSLRDYLTETAELCPQCHKTSRRIGKPFYTAGTMLLKLDKEFMRNQFTQNPYADAWLRGFGLMMKGIEKHGITAPFTPAAPFEIVWNVTKSCNLKCKHCYEDAGEKTNELTTEQAKQAIDKMANLAGIGLPALSFSGGEPLSRSDFWEIATYARKRIQFISIASNGTLITKDNAKRIKDAGVSYVEISLDGATAAVHDDFRGISGAYDRTIQGVQNCLNEGIDTCIATVFHKDNVAELDKLINLTKTLGVRFIHFNYIPTGRAKNHVELDLTPDQRLHILETLGKEMLSLHLQAKQEELEKGKSETPVDRYFSTCPQYASVTQQLSKQAGQDYMVEAHYAAQKGVEAVASFLGGCGAGRLYCCLEPNGDIKPCVFFPTNEEIVLGNILKNDFEQIWENNPLLLRLRNRELLRNCRVNGKQIGCASCPDRFICGGCRARSYGYFGGDVTLPDIGCIHNRPLWESMLKQEK